LLDTFTYYFFKNSNFSFQAEEVEVANAINSALVFKELDRELGQPDKRHNSD